VGGWKATMMRIGLGLKLKFWRNIEGTKAHSLA
jgi:hypothetical protein